MYGSFNNENNLFYADLPEEIKTERKYMSKIFYAFSFSYFLSLVALMIVEVILYALHIPENVFSFALNVISTVHTPLILLIMHIFLIKTPSRKHPVMSEMTFSSFVKLLLLCIFLMISGSVTGNIISALVGTIVNNNLENVVSDFVSEMSMWEIFIMAVVCAPVFEELIFRKLLIDKLACYGTSFCVIVSGVVFGLYHGNFYQFFYAFGIGCVLAYVYCICGKIRYSILIHAIINFIGSIVPLSLGIAETSGVTTAQIIYFLVYITCFVLGGIIFVVNFKKSRYNMVGGTLINPYKALVGSSGFIVTLVLSSFMFVVSVFG